MARSTYRPTTACVRNNPIAEYNTSGALTAREVWSAAGASRLILKDVRGGSPVSVTREYLLTNCDNSTTTLIGITSGGGWGTLEHYDYAPDGNTAAYQWNWSTWSSYSNGKYSSQFGMDFLWHGERYIQLYFAGQIVSTGGLPGSVNLTYCGGLYEGAYGGGWYDPQHVRLLAPSSDAPTQNPYDPHVSLFGSEWLGSHAAAVAGAAEAGIGLTITIATAGLLAEPGVALDASGRIKCWRSIDGRIRQYSYRCSYEV
jgi:hypothetical protein